MKQKMQEAAACSASVMLNDRPPYCKTQEQMIKLTPITFWQKMQKNTKMLLKIGVYVHILATYLKLQKWFSFSSRLSFVLPISQLCTRSSQQ